MFPAHIDSLLWYFSLPRWFFFIRRFAHGLNWGRGMRDHFKRCFSVFCSGECVAKCRYCNLCRFLVCVDSSFGWPCCIIDHLCWFILIYRFVTLRTGFDALLIRFSIGLGILVRNRLFWICHLQSSLWALLWSKISIRLPNIRPLRKIELNSVTLVCRQNCQHSWPDGQPTHLIQCFIKETFRQIPHRVFRGIFDGAPGSLTSLYPIFSRLFTFTTFKSYVNEIFHT